MKQNWEYSTFGQIMTPAKVERCKSRTDLPILSITMRDGIVFQSSRFKKVIASVSTENYKIVRNGQLVIAFPIDEGLIYTQDVVEMGIMSPAYNVWNVDYTKVERRFLVKYFHSPNAMRYYKLKLRGTTQRRRNLPKEDLLSMPIPIPPLSVQSRIVAELDLLTGIIDRQNAQLKELDNLAQAIFYDMFGDPIENPKGWNLEKLNNVSTLVNGRAYKQNELLDNGKYKVLRVGNFFTNGNYYYSDLELEKEKYCEKGDLLFAWSASFGAFIWQGEKVIYHYHIWKVLFDKKKLDIRYYRFLLNAMTNFFMKDVHGIGMVHLTKEGMEQYILPLPPLALQQSFAEKIQSIEKQKETISASIADTQKLLDYTMDKYFG